MADFLKSAANYFNSATAETNSIIGSVVQVNAKQFRIKRQIGEGIPFIPMIHF